MKLSQSSADLLFKKLLPLCAISFLMLIPIGQFYSLNFVFKAACILQLVVATLLLPISFVLTVMAFGGGSGSSSNRLLVPLLLFSPSIVFLIGGLEGLNHGQRHGWLAVDIPYGIMAIAFIAFKIPTKRNRETEQTPEASPYDGLTLDEFLDIVDEKVATYQPRMGSVEPKNISLEAVAIIKSAARLSVARAQSAEASFITRWALTSDTLGRLIRVARETSILRTSDTLNDSISVQSKVPDSDAQAREAEELKVACAGYSNRDWLYMQKQTSLILDFVRREIARRSDPQSKVMTK